MKKIYFLAFNLLLLFPLLTIATTWKIIPSSSSITFTAIQNNAPVSGKFTSFNGEINFDPTQLMNSKVRIVIAMNSLSASYKLFQETIKGVEWFDTKTYPQAIFTANKFIKTGDKTYQAQGNLTIRNKTLPVTLTFTLEQYSTGNALAKGSTNIKRTLFGVGTGEWSNTNEVKDEVKIEFELTATAS